MNVLVIGGTLFIGRHLVDALRGAGHRVTVLHRNPASTLPESVEGLIGDRNDAGSVERALAGREFDAVFDNVYDWARGTSAAQVAATAQACAGRGLRRYVFMSSVGAYVPGLGLDEDAALARADDKNLYASQKAESERVLFRMHREQGFPAVTLRPPFIYGPGNPFYREAFFWDRLRDGRPIVVPGDGSRLMQFLYVHDLVWCAMRILDAPRAVGQAFNLGEDTPLSQEQVVRALARASGREARIVYVPRETALQAGGSPMGPKLYFAQYFDLPPITMRVDKARELLAFRPTPFDEGLRATYAWWLANNSFPQPDYRFEDELLTRAAAS